MGYNQIMETGNRAPREVAESIIASGASTERRIRRYERAGRAGLLTAVGSGLAAGGEALISADPKMIYATVAMALVGAAATGLGVVADRMRAEHLRNLSKQISKIPKGDSDEQNFPPFDPPPDPGGAPVPISPQPYSPAGGESAAVFLGKLGITDQETEKIER